MRRYQKIFLLRYRMCMLGLLAFSDLKDQFIDLFQA